MRRKSSLREGLICKGYRIHTARLLSEHWLSQLVKLGKQKAMTKDSLTAEVTRVPGEYDSEAEALQAAKRYIDEEDAPRQDEGKENGTAPRQCDPTGARGEEARSMPEALPTEVEPLVVVWLRENLTRFHRDPRQAQAFEREVALLTRILFAGADAVAQCRARRVEGLSAKAVHGRFQVPYAMGTAVARAVMQRYAITFRGTAAEYEQQAEGLRRYFDQRREAATP